MNIVYLVIFMLGGDSIIIDTITSQSIPQVNMQQCTANAKLFSDSARSPIANGYMGGSKQMKAYCIVGIK